MNTKFIVIAICILNTITSSAAIGHPAVGNMAVRWATGTGMLSQVDGEWIGCPANQYRVRGECHDMIPPLRTQYLGDHGSNRTPEYRFKPHQPGSLWMQ